MFLKKKVLTALSVLAVGAMVMAGCGGSSSSYESTSHYPLRSREIHYGR